MDQISNNYAALELEILDWIRRGGDGRDFGEVLMAVHAFHRAACPGYGAFCQMKPEPGNWREIPAVPVDVFRRVALRAFPDAATVRTFRTSGTTGEGFGEHHFCSLKLYEAAALAGWGAAGLPRERVVALIPPPMEMPHSSLSQMAGWLVRPRDFFFGNPAGLRENVREPVVLFGTALAFLQLFEDLGDAVWELPAGSLAVETGGYKGTRRDLPKADLYRLFGEKLGLPVDSVWNEYGMTELSSQFYTQGLGRPHQGAAWVRALVVDPVSGEEVGDGETGVLRIFDAANLGSVCAIQTRDLAIRRGEAFELLGRDPAALPRGCSRAADERLS